MVSMKCPRIMVAEQRPTGSTGWRVKPIVTGITGRCASTNFVNSKYENLPQIFLQ